MKPSEDTLLEALRLNHDHVRGIARLDQQLIYVPLLALAAAVHEVLTQPAAISVVRRYGPIAALVLVLIPLIVGFGVFRNGTRHDEMLVEREGLLRQLDLMDEPNRKLPVWAGRLVYGLLFLVAWAVGATVLWSAANVV